LIVLLICIVARSAAASLIEQAAKNGLIALSAKSFGTLL